MNAPLLQISNLHVQFPIGAQLLTRNRRVLHAVSGVDLTLNRGECLSIVGESGCGKSTTALAVMGLQQPTSGDILFEGSSIIGANTPEAVGDYMAGPSHVLPTGGAVRFGSPLGVYDFVTRTSIVRYDESLLSAQADAICAFARLEGLEAHARAVEARLKR